MVMRWLHLQLGNLAKSCISPAASKVGNDTIVAELIIGDSCHLEGGLQTFLKQRRVRDETSKRR